MSFSDYVATTLHGDICAALKHAIGFNDDIAQAMAANVLREVQRRWGGREIYIPAPDSIERNNAIRADFNGRNHADVCKKYDISLRTLYRVIAPGDK